MDKLEQMADMLSQNIDKLDSLLIKSPTLDLIQLEVEAWAKKTDAKEKHQLQYAIGLMVMKINELEKQVEQLKRQIK